MLDLAGADAMGQRAESAVRGGVAVAADDGRAGQREALLRADDMHDALPVIELVEILDAEFRAILAQRAHLKCCLGIVDAVAAVGGRHIVIDDGQRFLGRVHAPVRHAQALESLRARHLVDEMAVDIKQARAVALRLDYVIVPNLIVQRSLRAHCFCLPLACAPF